MNNQILRVFIGYDSVETIAWHVMAHSILSRSSVPLALIPLKISNLKGIYTRPRDDKQSNEFSYTRFLVPFLSGYQGYALFFDCDMMVRVDINQIFNEVLKDPGKAVYVVKHNYEPKDEIKYLNTVQYKYPRKNWSSVVLWNCGHKANLNVTPEYVNNATGLEMHRFNWLKDEEIGDLNIRWNWLVGDYKNPPKDVKNVHWTVGGPYFSEYKSVDFSDEWFAEREKVMYCKQREAD
jgi:hypothetical protein